MLYIVGTPIGNLNDLSYRAAKILTAADILLVEDSRTTSHIFSKIEEVFHISKNPEQHIVSYYKEVEFEKLPQVIEWLKNGKTIALISDAGMPLISDPGSILIKTLTKENLEFTVIPAGTAFVNAALLSGFSTEKIFFMGFLPKKESEVVKIIKSLQEVNVLQKNTQFVFYESPERIHKTLEIIRKEISEAHVSVAREMTKKFEEVKRGKASELMNENFKGEIVLTILL